MSVTENLPTCIPNDIATGTPIARGLGKSDNIAIIAMKSHTIVLTLSEIESHSFKLPSVTHAKASIISKNLIQG
ncbi:MAG: hypothetical protein Q6L58_03755, partial [Thermostichales cyanobacterium BF3_bins_165]